MMGCARQRARQGRNKAACISIPWPQLRHAVMGTRMDVGGRSFAEGVRKLTRVGDDWRQRAADERFVISTWR